MTEIVIPGKTGPLSRPFPMGSAFEDLGPHDLIDCLWGPDKDGDLTISMSEPDMGYEEEDTPEKNAAHAAWLDDYCNKHRSKDS